MINYRCKCHMKNEHINNKIFCNSLIKRYTKNKNIFFKLKKNHSEQCLNLLINNIKNGNRFI